jgi:hypothetical protein
VSESINWLVFIGLETRMRTTVTRETIEVMYQALQVAEIKLPRNHEAQCCDLSRQASQDAPTFAQIAGRTQSAPSLVQGALQEAPGLRLSGSTDGSPKQQLT